VFGPAEQLLNSPYLQQSACLVSEVRMLGMNRTELVRYLVSEGYEVPVIITAYAFDEEAKARARANGALAYLIKLFDEEDLLRAIHRAFKSDSQQPD
jgi:FixJ family two-component response regulator